MADRGIEVEPAPKLTQQQIDENLHLNGLSKPTLIKRVEELAMQLALWEAALIDNNIRCACGALGYCEAGPHCGSGG